MSGHSSKARSSINCVAFLSKRTDPNSEQRLGSADAKRIGAASEARQCCSFGALDAAEGCTSTGLQCCSFGALDAEGCTSTGLDCQAPRRDEPELPMSGRLMINNGHGDLWPQLNGADAGTTDTRVLARLNFIRAQGYPLALIWPDGLDEHSKSSPAPAWQSKPQLQPQPSAEPRQ
jgi:hypothetical protein